MAQSGGEARCAGGAGSDAVADAGFVIYGCGWLTMSRRWKLSRLFFIALFLLIIIAACAVAPEAAAPPPAVEEPAAPER